MNKYKMNIPHFIGMLRLPFANIRPPFLLLN